MPGIEAANIRFSPARDHAVWLFFNLLQEKKAFGSCVHRKNMVSFFNL